MSEPEYKKGDRIELHPATDQWMMGDKFGVVISELNAQGFYRVLMDRSRRKLRVPPRDILKKV